MLSASRRLSSWTASDTSSQRLLYQRWLLTFLNFTAMRVKNNKDFNQKLRYESSERKLDMENLKLHVKRPFHVYSLHCLIRIHYTDNLKGRHWCFVDNKKYTFLETSVGNSSKVLTWKGMMFLNVFWGFPPYNPKRYIEAYVQKAIASITIIYAWMETVSCCFIENENYTGH